MINNIDFTFIDRFKTAFEQVKTRRKLGLNIKNRFYKPKNFKKSERKYVVVTAVYNTEKYLDEMLSSLLRQTLNFERNIKVVLVDDGSIDSSASICKEWADKYPKNIISIRKENGGQASARNEGLKYASGDWVTFIDSDDLVHERYFEIVDKNLNDFSANEIDAVSCRFVRYLEKDCRIEYNHPLDYRFKGGVRLSLFDNDCNDIQCSVNSVFLNLEALRKSEVQFKLMRCKGEDLLFINEYFLTIGHPKVLFLPEAEYFYRIRKDESSTLDGAWENKELYTLFPKLELELIESASNNLKKLPVWIQRTFLYHHSWEIKRFLNNFVNTSKIPSEVLDEYFLYLSRVISKIDPDLIVKFELSYLSFVHKYAILTLGHPQFMPASDVKSVWWDKDLQWICLRYYFTTVKHDLKILLNDRYEEPVVKKIRKHKFLNEEVMFECIAWYPWLQESKIVYEINGKKFLEENGEKKNIIKKFVPPEADRANLLVSELFYIELSKMRAIKSKYKDAWIFIDRDTQADDNAEHLYRWVSSNVKKINIWFALRRDSSDWDRLNKDEFKLIEFGSLDYKLALLNAAHVVSSHADNYIVDFLPRKKFGKYLDFKFTFLQHGVIQNDLSQWLNGKIIDKFITASSYEFKSIAGSYNSYKFTAKEVTLTGLPRHDSLLNKAKRKPKKQILIMPTWRKDLVGEPNGLGNFRQAKHDFIKSGFYVNWIGFLKNPKLKYLMDTFGYQVVFYLHENFKVYLNEFDVIGVQAFNSDVHDLSIQELFLNSSLLITDYSSVAFEMAYIKRPIIYYQFDDANIFEGKHTLTRGYFDYDAHGFGPVCRTELELFSNLMEILKNDAVMSEPYASRADGFFAFRDGRCSERVYNAISRNV